ncbi:unnamed protein product, partial [Didymodactylos carnosus]
MRTNYVQTSSFEMDIFQYIFSRWNFAISDNLVKERRQLRFKTEIKNISSEREDKNRFKFDAIKHRIVFQLKRIGIWLLTLIIFAGAITSVYFANEFTFREKSRKESGNKNGDRWRELAVEYLPSTLITLINLVSRMIFAYMRDLRLYTKTTEIQHYLL